MHFQYLYKLDQRLKEYCLTELLRPDESERLIFLNCTDWVQILALPLTIILLWQTT